MKILILTLGSRGDVQPYLALGAGLKRAGHAVTLATGRGFDRQAAELGLDYAPLNADFLALLQSPEGKKAVAGKNILKAIQKMMPVLREVLDGAWEAARGAEAIIYHPKALAGYSIAEKLGIPGFLAIPAPLFSPTRAFPNPALPFRNLGGGANHASYGLFLKALMTPYQGLINTWRKERLQLPPVPSELVREGRPVPKLYPFSRHVVPIPADWDSSSHVTGYWFLEEASGWQPPPELEAFLASGPAPVYVGFGSMGSEDASRLTSLVVEALQQAGQRGVLAAGWGGIASGSELRLPDRVITIQAAPHDWLFPRMAAVVHHGGAGTVAAGLRAGRPTVVCPFMGDQLFWGRRVAALGVGPEPIPQKKLSASRLGSAIRQAASDPEIRRQAETLQARICAEDGVKRAVEIITTHR